MGSYGSVHHRLRTARGPATAHSCMFCGDQAQDWSYDHLCPDEKVELRNGRSCPYSEDLDRYQPVCKPCHTYRDKGFESWERCLACPSRTRYSYCCRHWIGPRRKRGMQLGHQLPAIDEHGRRREQQAHTAVAGAMTHKTCGRCHHTLPVAAFAIQRSRINRPDSYKSICLSCDRAKAAAYYKAKTGRRNPIPDR